MEYVFTKIYEHKLWGDNDTKEYSGSSGSGSSINFNVNTYVPFLKSLIINNNINSIVDLGCGDFICGKLIYNELDVSYTGYDTYKKVIDYNANKYPLSKYSFKHLDFNTYKESIIGGDLCILKDVLQHWGLNSIYTFLDYLTESKKFKYILICNCGNQQQDDTDIENGNWRRLSSKFLPLKKYNPIIVGYYHTKELSIITL